ncbi:sesquipedalian-1 [Ambystoma mexicanum]|uniref:sesquipedalian-1 n=1 Tax=Ambystoma mexicanum TaxID=8296 RepID=UPI0037E95D89
MKLNERCVMYYGMSSSAADNTGFLYKKSDRSTAYHKRWFVLKGNMLFYFEDKESKEPSGAIILEGCTVELCESTEEYAFAIRFEYAKSRPYVFAASSQATMESWVKAISRANFDYMRLVVKELQKQLQDLQQTGLVARGRVACHNKKPIFNSEILPQAIDPEPQEQVVQSYSTVKENGCAVWNNTSNTDPIPNGHVLTASWEAAAPSPGASEENTPPPLPPRRRKKCGLPSRTAQLQPNGPIPPGTLPFSKLHDWFGKEIVALRSEWLERQLKCEQL